MFSVVEKLKFQLVMFSQSIESQKVQLFATLNLPLEIKDHTPDALEPMPLLLVTLKMAQGLESDYHLVQEKLFQETVEQQLELLLVEVETKNQS